MAIYYYELTNTGSGPFKCEMDTPEKAIDYLKDKHAQYLEVVYDENFKILFNNVKE